MCVSSQGRGVSVFFLELVAVGCTSCFAYTTVIVVVCVPPFFVWVLERETVIVGRG